MEAIKENNISGYPNVISFDCTKEIMNQMEKNICKIKIGEDQGTGFFCEIPFPDKKHMLKVLITANHIIGEDILYKEDAKISIYNKEAKSIKELNLNNRIKYTKSKDEYDITIIEIKEEDGINNYLELDDKIINDIINNDNENIEYMDKTSYIIQYPDGGLSVSYGIISNISEDNKYQFQHKCCTKRGSSGSPILNLKNKVVGLHTGGTKAFNLGTFLNYPIKDFINQYSNNKNDKIYKNDKNIIDDKINEILLKHINNKFKLNMKNFDVINYKPLGKYLGNDGFKELQELFLYYSNKIKSQFLDINFHKKIVDQLEKNICKIKVGNSHGTGFFCKVPFPDENNTLKVLITANHVLYDKILYNEDASISILINEEKKERLISLTNRIKYSSRDYDISIIEIKEEDKINNYLELDDKILNDILNDNSKIEKYKDNAIYILQNYYKFNLSVLFAMISGFAEDRKYIFKYNFKTNVSSGSPILDLNNKVLGVHYGQHQTHNYNFGIFLNYPLKEFIQKKCYKNKIQKELTLKENKKENNLSIEINKKKFYSIKKYLGEELLIELNKFYSSYKISFKYNFSLYGIFLSIDSCKIIINQLEHYICKIKIGNKETIGTFCKIPFDRNNVQSVLITDNNLLNKEILNKKDEKILIDINGYKEINLSNRRIYTSEEFATTIIEIKEEDKIKNYIELDNNIIDDIVNDEKTKSVLLYVDHPIYMIKSEFGILTVTYSVIDKIYEDRKYLFIYKGNIKKEPIKGPIFSAKTFKLIGQGTYCHYFRYLQKNGIFLNYPIKEYFKIKK